MHTDRVPIDRATWTRFVRSLKDFFTSEVGGRGMLLFGGLFAMLLAINGLNVVNSYVGRDFMTALESRNMPAFVRQAYLYVGVFAATTFVAVTYRFAEERLGLLWREWLTRKLLDAYTQRRRYQRLRDREDVGNPDQRIADDTRTFVVMTLSFVLMLLNGTFTIVAFSGVLFSISPLLWGAAVAYAALGSLVTVLLGGSLVRRNYDQADREASLRADLLQLRENADAVALSNREPSVRERLQSRLDGVVENAKRIIRVNRNLGYFTTGYNYLIQIIPALIMGPLFIRGDIEFGVISQSGMAFVHLLGAFSLIVTQFQSISSYAAVLARLGNLAEAFDALDGPATGIRMADASGRISFAQLSLRSPRDGSSLVSELTLSVPRGRNLLVTSADETPAVALFLATAGMWATGEGTIERPSGDRVRFVAAARPYLGPGTLREVLGAEGAADGATETVLRELGIESAVVRLGGLDVERNWPALLAPGEHLLLVLASVALAQPEFAFLHRIDTALGADGSTRVLRALTARSITCVTFSDSDVLKDEHALMLCLEEEGRWKMTDVTRAELLG